MTSRRQGSTAAGFALVEALASLVIVGMISLLLIQGMATGRRVWERIDSASSAGEAVDGAQTALRDRIEKAFLATVYGESAPYVDFSGSAGGLEFLAPPADADRPAPLRRYRLVLTTAGELVLSSISDVVAPQTAAASNQVLLSNVRQVDLAYFGAADPDQTRMWRPSWLRQPVPPELVRLRLSFEPGDRRHWPDLVIHPRATIDAACILSLLSHRCRDRQ
ncbi:MAG TPA: type II secretion system protein [Caulobacteraceae bacterium]